MSDTLHQGYSTSCMSDTLHQGSSTSCMSDTLHQGYLPYESLRTLYHTTWLMGSEQGYHSPPKSPLIKIKV